MNASSLASAIPEIPERDEFRFLEKIKSELTQWWEEGLEKRQLNSTNRSGDTGARGISLV